MADDSNSLSSSVGGLMGLADPQLLMSLGFGLMAGAKYGSNAGEGLLQGLQTYQGLKTAGLQRQLMQQQLQTGALGLQHQKMLTDAAQQAFQGDQGAQPTAPVGMPPSLPQAPQGAQQPFLPGISAMPSGAPPGMPVPSTQSGAPGLSAPSMGQVYGTTYPGGMPANFARAMSYLSADPLAAQQKYRDDQLKLAQQNYAPTLSKLDQLAKSDTPTKYMNGQAYADIKAAWPQMAAQYGLDPEKDYTDQNVRFVLNAKRNEFASALQEGTEAPPVPWQTRQGPLGSVLQSNPITGEEKEVVKPEPLKDVLGPNGQPMAIRASAAEGHQPFNQVTYGSAQMSGGPGALLAALATKGVSLPAGLRSQQQQIATLNGLIAANPDKTPDQIADLVRTGQLDFNGAKRSTAQLSTLSAAANAQMLKLEKDFQSIDPLVAKLPNAPAKINSIFTNLKNNWSFGGDKDSAELVGWIKESAGEYAKIISGATGSAGAGETSIKDAISQFQTAFSQGGYEGLKNVIMQSGQHRRDSYLEGLQSAATPGAGVGRPQGTVGGTTITLQPGQSHSVGGFTVTRVK